MALVAQMDATERMRQAEERAQWRAERAELDTIDTLMAELDRCCDEWVRAELTRAGYHQHKRGEWRKQRGPAEHRHEW
jgi:hypothetical protein